MELVRLLLGECSLFSLHKSEIERIRGKIETQKSLLNVYLHAETLYILHQPVGWSNADV